MFALRAPVTAALALLAFLGGAAIALTLGERAGAREIAEVAGVPLSFGLFAALLIRLGIALALAAILAEASLRFLEERAE